MTESTTDVRTLPERPVLAPWLRVVPHEDRLLLEHAGTVISLEGKAACTLLPRLLPLLDGSRTVDGIVETLGAAIAPATINALDLLNERGALLEGPQPAADGDAGREAAVFVGALGSVPPPEAHARLSSSTVAVGGRNATAAALAEVLAAAGVEHVERLTLDDRATRVDLLIAAPERDELAALRSVNDRQLEQGAPWLQVLPNDGRMIAIGPLFLPGVTACHTCYGIRRAAGSGFEDDFGVVESASPKAGSPKPLTMVAAGVAGVLALRWLACADPTLPGRFYSLETGIVLGLRQHLALRVPRCPSCGTGDAAMPSPWFDVKALDA